MLTAAQKLLLNDVTIVITVRERCKHLRRALDYYSHFPVRVLVMDSSDCPCRIERKPENFSAIYLPQKFYSDALVITLAKVDTPYVLIASDDDFFIPAAIADCVLYLKEHEDYQCVYGYVGQFVNQGKIKLSDAYPHLPGAAVSADTPQDRVIEHLGHYVTNYHSVHKIQSFLAAIKEGCAIKNLSASDIVTGSIVVMYGKSKALPVLFSVREKILTAQSSLLGKTTALPKFGQALNSDSPQALVLVQECVNMLTDALVRRGIKKDSARKSVQEAFKSYAAFLRDFAKLQLAWREKLCKENIKTFEEVLSEEASQQNWAMIKAVVVKHDLNPIVSPLLVDDEGHTIKHWYNSQWVYFFRIRAMELAMSTLRLGKRAIRMIQSTTSNHFNH